MAWFEGFQLLINIVYYSEMGELKQHSWLVAGVSFQIILQRLNLPVDPFLLYDGNIYPLVVFCMTFNLNLDYD